MKIERCPVTECTLYAHGVYRVHFAVFNAVVIGMCLLAGVKISTAGDEISRIAIGSCAHQDASQPIWDPIVAANPDLFIFMGDNIYADTDEMAVMRARYRKSRVI